MTHDQSEAVVLGDRIGVMENGKLMQMSPPVELYNRPENLFVANFTGVSNLIKGELARARHREASRAARCCASAQPTPGKAGDAVLVAVRPENIVLRANGDAADAVNSFPARVIEGHFHGTQTTYAIETLGHRLEAIELGTVPRFTAQDSIRVVIPPDHPGCFRSGCLSGRQLGAFPSPCESGCPQQRARGEFAVRFPHSRRPPLRSGEGRSLRLDLRVADDLAVFRGLRRRCTSRTPPRVDPIGSKPSIASRSLMSGCASALATRPAASP